MRRELLHVFQSCDPLHLKQAAIPLQGLRLQSPLRHCWDCHGGVEAAWHAGLTLPGWPATNAIGFSRSSMVASKHGKAGLGRDLISRFPADDLAACIA